MINKLQNYSLQSLNFTLKFLSTSPSEPCFNKALLILLSTFKPLQICCACTNYVSALRKRVERKIPVLLLDNYCLYRHSTKTSVLVTINKIN
jgi:hypothetical protein